MHGVRERAATVPRPRAAAPILAVDDDPTIRSFLSELLKDEGYAVFTASNGQAALEHVRRGPVSLIFLDMQMPVMDGWSFVKAYHAGPLPHAPIVCMTAASEAAAWSTEIEAAAVLRKPFHLNQVLSLVDRFIPASSG